MTPKELVLLTKKWVVVYKAYCKLKERIYTDDGFAKFMANKTYLKFMPK